MVISSLDPKRKAGSNIEPHFFATAMVPGDRRGAPGSTTNLAVISVIEGIVSCPPPLLKCLVFDVLLILRVITGSSYVGRNERLRRRKRNL
jgi:hypothetical protein